MRIDILDLLWQLFRSRRLAIGLLSAILVALTAGAILPQMPNDLLPVSPENTQWRADIRAGYGQWADPLESLGLFSIRNSLWLKAPLALLAVNLLVCTVENLEESFRWRRLRTEGLVHSLPSASLSRSIFLPGLRDAASVDLREALQDFGYPAHILEDEGGSYVIGRRLAWARWGLSLAHGGALVIVLALLAGGRLAWTEQGITLSVGQQYQVQHPQYLAIRLDELRAELDSPGGAPSGQARVTVLDSEQEVSSGTVLAGAPLWYKGMSICWLSQGPLIRFEARDASGEPLSLQALAPSGELTEEVVVQFSNEESEGYVAVPERNLVLRLVLQPTEDTQALQPPLFLWEAYRGGSTEVVSRKTVRGSASLDIDGDTYFAEWGQYAILGISSDPSILPLTVGIVVLLIGSTLFLFWRPRLIWAIVRGTQSVVQIQVFSPGREDSGLEPREFEKLVTQIEEVLGAP